MISDDFKRRYLNDAIFHALVCRILQASEGRIYSFGDVRAAVDVAEYIAQTGGTERRRHDIVCEHGTAMDVHCCNCHSGFIFDNYHVCPTEGR